MPANRFLFYILALIYSLFFLQTPNSPPVNKQLYLLKARLSANKIPLLIAIETL